MGYTPSTGQQLLNLAVQAYNSEAAVPANTNPGSTLGAIFEAGVLLGLQLQQQISYQFDISRLASSTGSDVDSFVQPFGIARGGPTFASGAVTFSYPVGQQQTILVGSQVQTPSGVIFTVIADPNNTTGDFNTSLNGYIANPVATTLVQCNQSGIIGNVLANTITLQYGGFPPIVGSPTITNPSAFTNAIATETDSALKVRFAQFISGGGEGTVNSIIAAVSNVQSGITFSYGDQWESVWNGSSWVLTPNTQGWFTIVANIANQASTSGATALCTAINNAIMFAVRPAGISYNVIPPTLQTVKGAGHVVLQPGYAAASVLAAVGTAFQAFVNGIGLNQYGATTVCAISQVAAALQAVPGVYYVDGITLNGYGADILGQFGTQLVASTDVSGFTN